MEREPFVPSVLFFKRLIAATLAFIILSLTTLSIVTGVRLHRARGRIDGYEAAEEVRLAEEETEEEAERLRTAIPGEKQKPADERDALEILSEQKVVAHALGAVGGYLGLNCMEGFLRGYDAGVRVFEADFRLTSDGHVALRHDWTAGLQEGISVQHVPTLEEFRDAQLCEMFTPLSFGDLLLLLERYEDVCIITDTKFIDEESVNVQFEEMVNEAHRLGRSYLLDRLIVQVYNKVHFSIVDNVHHFPHYIFTFYQDGFPGTEEGLRTRLDFAKENGIEAVTIPDILWNPEWKGIVEEAGIKVYVHTVNDVPEAKWLLDNGVNAIYTDSIRPAYLEE